jgi:hypothetical protein
MLQKRVQAPKCGSNEEEERKSLSVPPTKILPLTTKILPLQCVLHVLHLIFLHFIALIILGEEYKL